MLVEYFEFNHRYTQAGHTEHFSSALRDVNDTSGCEWATIIDAHHDRTASTSVGHTHARSEGQCPVSRSHIVGAKDFTVRGMTRMAVIKKLAQVRFQPERYRARA